MSNAIKLSEEMQCIYNVMYMESKPRLSDSKKPANIQAFTNG